MPQSNRIFYYDLLRAIAIMGIVFCHSAVPFIMAGTNAHTFYISAFFDCFRDFSIPVFVMLSGALLIGKKDTFKDFFKKRLSRIFVPFLFWAAVYIIYSSIFITHAFKWDVAVDIFFGASSTLGVIFWFIWMIVVVYILIFFINKLMSYWDNLINALALMSLIYIVISYCGLYMPSSRIAYFVSFISYAIIGYFITHNDYLSSRVGINKLIAGSLILSVGSYLFYIFSFVVPRSIISGHFVNLSYFNIPILFISANIFLFFKYLSKAGYLSGMENHSIGNWVKTISKYSFGIYLTHYLIIFFLKVGLIRYVAFTSQNPLLWIPLFVVLTTLISLAILSILDRIPYLNRFSGNG